MQGDHHALDERADVCALHKAHFKVELREFKLAIGAQVFIAEAARNLEVALNTCHHEQLLELLRALRQRIEFARVQAAGHHEVARAFGRCLEQDGRLHFKKVALGEVFANEAHNVVAQR